MDPFVLSGPSAPRDLGSQQALGLRFDRHRAEFRGVIVSFPLLVQRFAPTITSVAALPIPTSLLRQMQTLEREKWDADLARLVRQEICALASSLTEKLLSNGDDHILAVGCHGTGIWLGGVEADGSYLELLDAARLAEAFGKTVVCDFVSRDIARRGAGEAAESHGLGLLLADRDAGPGYRWRGVLEISERITRMTLVPPLNGKSQVEDAFSYDIGPGMRLLADLKQRVRPAISEGRDDRDVTGARPTPTPPADRSSVAGPSSEAGQCGESEEIEQPARAGTAVRELEELWMATLSTNAPSLSASGTSSALPLLYALDQSPYRSCNLSDLLATARFFLTRRIAEFVHHRVPASRPIGELLIMGEGVRDDVLIGLLAETLAYIPMRKLDELGQDRSLLAASVAALTMLHIWHIPLANNGGDAIPRVLGTITPGSPSNWRRVLHEMTLSAPDLLPLREAI